MHVGMYVLMYGRLCKSIKFRLYIIIIRLPNVEWMDKSIPVGTSVTYILKILPI